MPDTTAKPTRITLADGEFTTLIHCTQGFLSNGDKPVVNAAFGPSGVWISVPADDPYRWDVLVLAKLRGVPLSPGAQAAYDALPEFIRTEIEKA